MTTKKVNDTMLYRLGGQCIPIYTTLFLILMDKGYLNLNDYIGKFLPQVSNCNLITLEMLGDSTAGLPDVINTFTMLNEKNVFKNWTDDELLNIVYTLTPLYPPGEHYCNLNLCSTK